MVTIENNILNRRRIADGVYFTDITDRRFKNDKISVFFITKLCREKNAANAIIPRMLIKCTEKYPTMSALNRRLSELYGMSLGWYVSGEGDMHKLEINVTSLNNRFALDGEDITLEAANMLKEAIFSPYFEDGLFPADSLETEKQNQRDDLEAEINDKTTYAFLKGSEEAFKNEPAALKWCGTADDISAITPESAISAYREMLRTMNVEIICSGGSDFSSAEKIFSEAFGNIGRQPESFPTTLPSPVKEKTSHITEKLDIKQSKLVMCYKIKAVNKPALTVMSCMFGGVDSSKLFKNVREKLSLCYYCFCRSMYYKNFLTAEFGVDHENIEKTKAECEKQLKDLTDGVFTDEDIDNAKRYIINSIRTVNDSANAKLSWYMSQLIYPTETDTPESYISKLNAVTREDIINTAKSAVLDTVYVLTSGEKEDNA